MKKWLTVFSVALLCLVFFSSICLAATVSGSGSQTRGYPGHNAEIHGELFTLPRAGSITNIESRGTNGFWIENRKGVLIENFNSINDAYGYALPAGSYRIIPNIKDGYNSSWVNVTFTYP